MINQISWEIFRSITKENCLQNSQKSSIIESKYGTFLCLEENSYYIRKLGEKIVFKKNGNAGV